MYVIINIFILQIMDPASRQLVGAMTDQICQGGTWATDAELFAAADMLKTPISVFVSQFNQWYTYKTDSCNSYPIID